MEKGILSKIIREAKEMVTEETPELVIFKDELEKISDEYTDDILHLSENANFDLDNVNFGIKLMMENLVSEYFILTNKLMSNLYSNISNIEKFKDFSEILKNNLNELEKFKGTFEITVSDFMNDINKWIIDMSLLALKNIKNQELYKEIVDILEKDNDKDFFASTSNDIVDSLKKFPALCQLKITKIKML